MKECNAKVINTVLDLLVISSVKEKGVTHVTNEENGEE